MLHYGELVDVLSNYCEIGMYDPKSGSDDEIVVINLFYSEEEAGKDLKRFIEYMPMEIIDVTAQDHMYDNQYKIFIELEKTKNIFENVCQLLRDCAGLADIEEWEIKVYRKDVKKITVEEMEKVTKESTPTLDDEEHNDVK